MCANQIYSYLCAFIFSFVIIFAGIRHFVLELSLFGIFQSFLGIFRFFSHQRSRHLYWQAGKVSPTSPAQAVARICPPIDSDPPDGSAPQAPRLNATRGRPSQTSEQTELLWITVWFLNGTAWWGYELDSFDSISNCIKRVTRASRLQNMNQLDWNQWSREFLKTRSCTNGTCVQRIKKGIMTTVMLTCRKHKLLYQNLPARDSARTEILEEVKNGILRYIMIQRGRITWKRCDSMPLPDLQGLGSNQSRFASNLPTRNPWVHWTGMRIYRQNTSKKSVI